MNEGPNLNSPVESRERNWLPLAIAAAVVVIVAVVVIAVMEHGKSTATVAPIGAAQDPYAANLPITSLVMSESANLAGGKVTYIDGHIANKGNLTVSAVTVQVLFRDIANEVAQNETQKLKLIRTRDPYVDLETIAAAPLRPGDEHDFRLIFDAVAAGWNGAYPEIRILHVDAK